MVYFTDTQYKIEIPPPREPGIRQIILTKGTGYDSQGNKINEKYIFRYLAGQEDLLLDALVASVKDPKTSFDWFDAAVLSFKLTQSLIAEADKLLNQDNIDPTNQNFDPTGSYKS